MTSVNIINLSKPGMLRQCLNEMQIDTCTSIAIIGYLNKDDICLLRSMGGAISSSQIGKLRILDLRKANFVNDSRPYLVLNMKDAMMQGKSSPEFYNSPSQDEEYQVSSNNPWSASKTVQNKGHIAYNRASYTIHDTQMHDESCVTESLNRLRVDFTKSPTEKDRKKMKSYNMFKVKAHKIKWEKDHYTWYAYLRKGLFCYDMFYGCKTLEAIALPEGIKTLESVHEMNDSKRYYTSKGQ